MKRFCLFILLTFLVEQHIVAQEQPTLPAITPANLKKAQERQGTEIPPTAPKTRPAPDAAPNVWSEGVVRGCVRGSTGPLVNAYVHCGGQVTSTDENGDYRFSGIREGEHYLYVATCVLEKDSPNRCKDPGIAAVRVVQISPAYVSITLGPQNPVIEQNFNWEKRGE